MAAPQPLDCALALIAQLVFRASSWPPEFPHEYTLRDRVLIPVMSLGHSEIMSLAVPT